MRRDSAGWIIGLATAGVLATLIVMVAPLTPHGFTSGDQGLKLIAARNAIAHPTRPLQLDLPRIGTVAVEFVDLVARSDCRTAARHAHVPRQRLAGRDPGLSRLEAAGVSTVHLAWSTQPDHPGPMRADGTCYRLRPPAALTERRIHIADAVCHRQ